LSTPSTSDVVSKKIRVPDAHEHQQEQLPEYFQITNKIFDQPVTNHVTKNSTAATTIIAEDIQQMATLKRKIDAMNIHRKLGCGYRWV
jgi:hypothetical protein